MAETSNKQIRLLYGNIQPAYNLALQLQLDVFDELDPYPKAKVQQWLELNSSGANQYSCKLYSILDLLHAWIETSCKDDL